MAVVLAGIGAFLNLNATQPILPLFAELFSASKSAVGMTVSATMIGVVFSAPFCGVLAERLGRKRVILYAMTLLAFPTMLTATSGSLNALIMWRFLQGIVIPGVFGVVVAYITEEWPAWNVVKVVSYYVSGTVLGGFIGRVLVGYSSTHAIVPGVAPSWRVGFVTIGILDLIFAAIILRWLPPDSKGLERATPASLQGRTLQHLRNPQLVATYAVGFNVLFSLAAIFTYINFVLADAPYFWNPAQLSYLFVVYLVGLVVTPFGGTWISKVGSRLGLIVAMLVAMAGVTLTLVHSALAILLGLVLCCTGVFICQCSASSYLQTAAPAGERASAAGLYVAFYYLGGSLAGVLPGYVWRFGGWTACVILVLLIQITAIFIAAAAWKQKAEASASQLPTEQFE